MPEVSVVIPVYNQETYLGAAIDSVFAQTFRDLEVVVVDDGSTDRTPDVVASYGSRVRALRQPNAGNAAAFNRGVRASTGRWIAWLGSDDVWVPTKLERQVDAVRSRPAAGLVYTDVVTMDAGGKALYTTEFPCPDEREACLRFLLRKNFINVSTALVRRDVFESLGPFDEKDWLCADYDMWLRVAERYDIVRVPEPLVWYRVHPGQLSRKGPELERGNKRAAMRAVRRIGLRRGMEGAVLRFTDEVLALPWMARSDGGAYGWRERFGALWETLRIFVDPTVH
ncbi:MAG TPA: glycosyltransferase [Thermoplasmata archaeon]|nr:glycosyltransferase [Thermoplasmata archaeon]